MHRLIGILALFLATAVAAQTPTPATFNPVPQQNASFFTTLRTFLLGEDADRFDVGFNDFRFENCTHGTAAGFTGTFGGTCRAFINGKYILEPAASLNYSSVGGAGASDTCWTAVHVDTTTVVSGWSRLAGSHYIVKCNNTSTPRPTLPADSMIVMRVTISASAITAVEVEANLWPSVRTFLATSEIDTTRMGQWWQSVVNNLMCYTTDGSFNCIPLSDAAGCATCGDSATSFFSTGQIEPARGGTGDDTSATTGVPFINAGNWTYDTQLSPAHGGLGADNSAATGIVTFQSGTLVVDNFPEFTKELVPPSLAVDGAQCVQNDNAVLATGVIANVIECADNANGRIFGIFRIPTGYTTDSALLFRLAAQNTGTTSGVTGFDFSCMCDSSGDTSSAANFSSPTNVDFTWSGTDNQVLVIGTNPTCGGTCIAADIVIAKWEVDATATTHTVPADIKYTLASMRGTADGM